MIFDVNITIEKIDDDDDVSIAIEEHHKYANFIDNLNELIEKVEELSCQLYDLEIYDYMKEYCYDKITDSKNTLKRVREMMTYG